MSGDYGHGFGIWMAVICLTAAIAVKYGMAMLAAIHLGIWIAFVSFVICLFVLVGYFVYAIFIRELDRNAG